MLISWPECLADCVRASGPLFMTNGGCLSLHCCNIHLSVSQALAWDLQGVLPTRLHWVWFLIPQPVWLTTSSLFLPPTFPQKLFVIVTFSKDIVEQMVSLIGWVDGVPDLAFCKGELKKREEKVEVGCGRKWKGWRKKTSVKGALRHTFPFMLLFCVFRYALLHKSHLMNGKIFF